MSQRRQAAQGKSTKAAFSFPNNRVATLSNRMIFLEALESMTSIALLCLVGFFLAKGKWVSSETEIFLPKLITKVVLPPYLMSNIVGNFDRQQLLSTISSALVPMGSMLLCFLLFRLLAILLCVDKKHRGLFAVAGTVSNTILIGIPVNVALFGESSLPYVLLYFFANTLFFWIFGAYVIAQEGSKSQTLRLSEKIRQIFSPPLCGVLLGISLVLLGLPLPRVLAETCRYLGQLATPLALIFVGITLARVEWRKAHMGKDIVCGLLLRLAIAPLVLIVMLHFLPLPHSMAQVFIIQSALPCMAIISVMSAYYGADREYASSMVALSTVLGMVSVPVWMSVIHTLFPVL
ncbi:MAG: AEC family transporter [Desulfovibrio sp.]|nr:AEC family transporter [Desulfovibrio sp.]